MTYFFTGDPQTNPEATGDAYKTLFIARLSYETSERKLKKELENHGPIKRVRIVRDQEGKSRGYAFVEYANENDMRSTSCPFSQFSIISCALD